MRRVHSSGGKRMKELGKVVAQLWISPEDRETLKELADKHWSTLGDFVVKQLRPLMTEHREQQAKQPKGKKGR